MHDLDFDHLRSVATSGLTPLFATVSGAHLYGFPSPDSDVDLRGAFVLPVKEVIGLREPVETLTTTRTVAGVEVDWVAHDVRKFARLMTRRNGYVLEQLYSPLVVIGGPWLDELAAIGRGCITRQLYHHYRGFANGQLKLLAQPTATVKELLYAYRVLLTGIHVLRTGAIEAHLGQLIECYSVPSVTELMARKQTGAERSALATDELPTHLAQLARLEADLAADYEACALPDAPTALDALNDFVVRARLELGDHD
jgi:predicted nucleotidyltransferase